MQEFDTCIVDVLTWFLWIAKQTNQDLQEFNAKLAQSNKVAAEEIEIMEKIGLELRGDTVVADKNLITRAFSAGLLESQRLYIESKLELLKKRIDAYHCLDEAIGKILPNAGNLRTDGHGNVRIDPATGNLISY